MKIKSFAVRVLLTVLICVVLCSVASAAVKDKVKGKKPQQVPKYHQGDVRVIQGIIKNNGLNSFNINAPASWSFVAWSNTMPKRVVSLDFYAPDTREFEDGEEYDGPDDGLGVSGSIDLRPLSELMDFSCVGTRNSVYEVNASNCKKLKSFGHDVRGYSMPLKELNVSGCTALEELYVEMGTYDNEKFSLKALGCRALKGLSVKILANDDMVQGWWTSNIKLADFPNLEELRCSNNSGITALDISKNPKLRYLDCSYTQIRTLDISKNQNLEFLNCEGTNIKKLDTSRNKKLTDLIWDGKR